MSKERLEEIKAKSKYRDRGYFGGYMSFKDTNRLIEQAERVEKLRMFQIHTESLAEVISDLEQQNKCYRYFLEQAFKADDLEDIWNIEDEYRALEDDSE